MPRHSHVALLIPHTDVTLESDMQNLLSAHVIHTQRMWLSEIGEEAERKMVDIGMPEAVRYLKGIRAFDCAVFGCTSASAVYGRQGLADIESFITRELGCPSVTALGAVLREIERRGAKSVAMLTPYTDEVNRFMSETLERFSVPVCYANGMSIADDHGVSALTPQQILSYAEKQKENIPRESDLCFFSCTNLRAAEIRRELEEVLDRQVITSNHCIMEFVKKY